MLENFLKEIKDWAEKTPYIEAVLLVGSMAKGRAKKNSDIDLVIISTKKDYMVKNQDFIKNFGKLRKKQTEYYGACTSIRSFYKDKKEVEFGLVAPSWIKKPLDQGTREVLRDGYRVIFDKKGYFKDLDLYD